MDFGYADPMGMLFAQISSMFTNILGLIVLIVIVYVVYRLFKGSGKGDGKNNKNKWE